MIRNNRIRITNKCEDLSSQMHKIKAYKNSGTTNLNIMCTTDIRKSSSNLYKTNMGLSFTLDRLN